MRILYIDIDSLRPDHLGCYGYHRNTSPTIDALAREGVRFNKVYTPDAPCLPSRTAMYSGRFGIQTGVVGHGGTAAQPKIEGPTRSFSDRFHWEGFASRLQRLDHHTALISPFGQRHAAWHFYAGFHEIHNTAQMGKESAEEVQPIVDKWIEENASEENWYLHVNYWDPHTPYRVPKDEPNPFAEDPIPAWLDDEELIRRHNQIAGPHTSLEIGMYNDEESPDFPRHPGKVTDRASMRKMIDGYDHAVRYVDDHIARIVSALKKQGVYDETAIIISADHGENLGELGIYAEHGTADDTTCRIPLVIKWPGGMQGHEDNEFHYNLDFVPTVMDLLGGDRSPWWDGKSFAPTIREGSGAGREEVILSQCSHVCQRSVRWENWIYLRTYHDGFRLFPQEMLFDLEADPHEQNDLAGQHPDLCREGLWRLSRWHDEQMQNMVARGGDGIDPLWTVIREGGPFHAGFHGGNPGGVEGFRKYLRHLENTGRGDKAGALREKYAANLPG